ncbi:MAG: PIN family protein [Saprospiraceae bacterium]
MGAVFAAELIDLLLELPNTHRVERYIKWYLLGDADDNKFPDCAIAAGAHYLVSEDNDFRPLNNIPFPRVNLMRNKEFVNLLNAM